MRMTEIYQIGRRLDAYVAASRSFVPASLVALVLSMLSTIATAQNENVIRVETELVSFEVRATDAEGKPVSGLSASDFRVFENGSERKIDFFQPMTRPLGKRPLAVVFALDVSGSMTEAELERLERHSVSLPAGLRGPMLFFSIDLCDGC